MTTNHKKPRQSVPAVNFHLLLACNMACGHCFAANLSPERMPVGDAVKMIKMISQAGFWKINFAGGEPMLHPGLDSLIRAAKQTGMVTSIVTNGTKITDRWLDDMSGYLDWIALSMDSADPRTHKLSGRAMAGGPLLPERYLDLCRSIRLHGMRLKINTVVTIHNHHENMKGFILKAQPERWKIMQALPVRGQNDRASRPFEVTGAQFDAYVERNKPIDCVKVVPEDNDMMTCSYVMVDPLGRFYDNADGAYRHSHPILQIGVEKALLDVMVDPAKFEMRGGRYDW